MATDDAAYRAWLARNGITDAGQFYDYRSAFKAGATRDASGHWPSDFKKPGHPNEIVGGFNTRTGERAPGTTQVSESELVRLGWDAVTAKRLSQQPMAKDYIDVPLTPVQKRKAIDVVNDLVMGAGKGLAQTTTNVVGMIPGVTTATRGIGNAIGGAASNALYGTTSPPVSGEQVSQSLEATNTAQRIGKGVEQVAEFLTPIGGASKLESKLVGMGLKHGIQPLIRGANATAKTIEGGLQAGATALAHGDEHPERAALLAGAGPLVGEVARPIVGLIKYPISRQLLSIVAGVAGASAIGGVTPASLGGGFAIFSLSKSVARSLLSKPDVIPTIQGLAAKGSTEAARFLSALQSVAGPQGTLEEVEAK